ncbi:MAG TPA: enoyl-CoA hydratase/isomerase family protein [Candidatus Limnocylindria bacterium]|nr:enoyl-CoA hydratase/isomerase family protein [Candidatus Limnocylindria bacterium]
MPDGVTMRSEAAVCFVALDRPAKRNAIDRAMLARLVETLDAVAADDTVRAVVLYGEGPVFSAGVDLGMLRADVGDGTPAAFRERVRGMQAALGRIETLEKPVIAAMHRYAAGLALELALACDLRVASEDCELGLPEVRLGLVPDVGGTTRLVRTVGYARAKELLLTGRMISAAQAHAVGLVHEVVPPGTHLDAGRRLAAEIAANAPLAVGVAKRLVDLGANADAHTFLELELWAQSLLKHTEDAREGARAALERRPPRFTGK